MSGSRSLPRIEDYDNERLFHDKHVDPLRRIQGTLQEVSRPIYNENITLVLPDDSMSVDRIGRLVFWYDDSNSEPQSLSTG